MQATSKPGQVTGGSKKTTSSKTTSSSSSSTPSGTYGTPNYNPGTGAKNVQTSQGNAVVSSSGAVVGGAGTGGQVVGGVIVQPVQTLGGAVQEERQRLEAKYGAGASSYINEANIASNIITTGSPVSPANRSAAAAPQVYPAYLGPKPSSGDPLGLTAAQAASPGYAERNRAGYVNYPTAFGGGQGQVKFQEAMNAGYTGRMKTPFGGGMAGEIIPGEEAIQYGGRRIFERGRPGVSGFEGLQIGLDAGVPVREMFEAQKGQGITLLPRTTTYTVGDKVFSNQDEAINAYVEENKTQMRMEVLGLPKGEIPSNILARLSSSPNVVSTSTANLGIVQPKETTTFETVKSYSLDTGGESTLANTFPVFFGFNALETGINLKTAAVSGAQSIGFIIGEKVAKPIVGSYYSAARGVQEYLPESVQQPYQTITQGPLGMIGPVIPALPLAMEYFAGKTRSDFYSTQGVIKEDIGTLESGVRLGAYAPQGPYEKMGVYVGSQALGGVGAYAAGASYVLTASQEIGAFAERPALFGAKTTITPSRGTAINLEKVITTEGPESYLMKGASAGKKPSIVSYSATGDLSGSGKTQTFERMGELDIMSYQGKNTIISDVGEVGNVKGVFQEFGTIKSGEPIVSTNYLDLTPSKGVGKTVGEPGFFAGRGGEPIGVRPREQGIFVDTVSHTLGTDSNLAIQYSSGKNVGGVFSDVSGSPLGKPTLPHEGKGVGTDLYRPYLYEKNNILGDVSIRKSPGLSVPNLLEPRIQIDSKITLESDLLIPSPGGKGLSSYYQGEGKGILKGFRVSVEGESMGGGKGIEYAQIVTGRTVASDLLNMEVSTKGMSYSTTGKGIIDTNPSVLFKGTEKYSVDLAAQEMRGSVWKKQSGIKSSLNEWVKGWDKPIAEAPKNNQHGPITSDALKLMVEEVRPPLSMQSNPSYTLGISVEQGGTVTYPELLTTYPTAPNMFGGRTRLSVADQIAAGPNKPIGGVAGLGNMNAFFSAGKNVFNSRLRDTDTAPILKQTQGQRVDLKQEQTPIRLQMPDMRQMTQSIQIQQQKQDFQLKTDQRQMQDLQLIQKTSLRTSTSQQFTFPTRGPTIIPIIPPIRDIFRPIPDTRIGRLWFPPPLPEFGIPNQRGGDIFGKKRYKGRFFKAFVFDPMGVGPKKKTKHRRKSKGQVSWVWTTILSVFVLAVTVGLWIVMDESKNRLQTVAYANPLLDLAGASMFSSMWAFIPILLLGSWGLYVWIMAAATRGSPE
jgi:hypothetical protein